MRFSASYDRTTKVVSTLVLALFAVLAVIAPWFVSALLVIVLPVAYFYSPRGYTISEGALTIERWIGRVSIPLGEITMVRPATAEDLRGTLRLWGSGGLFGYYGLFRTSALGKCWWYVTRRDRLIVVAAGTRVYLLSPDDADAFLRAMPEAGGAIQAGTGSQSHWYWWLIGVAFLMGPAIVIVALSYNPGPPRYTMTSSTLAIHDRFYPVTLGARDVDVAGVRVVDLAEAAEWRPARRTNGFANRHYQSGWFETQGGQSLRLYRAGSRRLVLLPAKGDGTAVLLEVDNPDSFAERARREWGG